MKNHFLIFAAAFLATASLFAQDRKDKAPVTFEEIYDEPYSVNKLFVAFQPLYGEVFVTNINAGFGVEALYYHMDKLDVRAHFRKTYSQRFFDLSRDLAVKNSDVDNANKIFSYYELGGTYHVKDFEESSKTKMFLYKNSYRGNRWASRVPLYADVPCKVRKIYGVRFGGIAWNSSVDLNRVLTKQGLTHRDLVVSGEVPEGQTPESIPATEFDEHGQDETVDLFTNVAAKGIYAGGSLAWIKNVAVNFDKFEEGVDDLMLTVYADILFSPSIALDDIVYTKKVKDTNGNVVKGATNTYSVSPIKTQSLGFRLGIDGRFNRTLSWAYGGEIGYRPGIAGKTFYALFKISFPVYGTNLDYKVESFGK
ncbi:hypothetical protein KK083_16845 [Fulvivirgaceae bacterium PWU4]|uniref:DUF4421 domain-containing protein n=1 Tax=Chryseosolibacter histidini TaxID=2782349 RepID=A0AAP2DPF0_9BACT|nr:hypothetical protein [Chryseosolibacter histidini]MBT1698562.1 hypothetical protein [Chryseosolibacter histidini]